MGKHAFLSDEWVEAAQAIRDEFKGKAQPVPHTMKANLNITEVPFGEGTVAAQLDSSSGQMEMDMGHMDEPELTLTVDWLTAKAIIVDGNPQAGMQAFMAGKIRVEGDMTKIMAMQNAPVDPVALEVATRIQAITE
ncbi:MAG TPA: SCP2 sterol-binding domain-containing protein [Acidimicrobiales bacterium]